MDISVRYDDHYVYLNTSFGMKDEIKASIQGARWMPDSREWRGIIGARNSYVIDHVWKGSPQFKRYYTEPPPHIEKELRQMFPGRWSHQYKAAAYVIHRRRFIYAAEMALGKTVTAFDAVEYIGYGPCWWVSDKNSLKAFHEQMDKWKPKIKFSVVVNYEGLAKECRRAIKPPRVVVFDECSALKNSKAARTQAAMALVGLMELEYGDDCFVIMLSGTPAPKDIRDWWAVAEVCRPGFIRESRIEKFTERYMVCTRAEKGYLEPQKDEDGKYLYTTEYPKLGKRLAPLVLCHRRGIDNPDMRQLTKEYQELKLEPDPEALEAVKMLLDTAPNAGAALQAIRQASDGVSVKAGMSFECPKDAALRDHLDKHTNRCIIYAAYRLSIDKITDICRQKGWHVVRVDGRGWSGIGKLNGNGAQELLKFFSRPDIYTFPIAFVAHPRAAGKGLTLTASPSIAFYSRTYMYEDSAQAEDRIMRESSIGQLIVDFLNMPIDYSVLANVKSKRRGNDITFNDIRAAYGLPPLPVGGEAKASEYGEDDEEQGTPEEGGANNLPGEMLQLQQDLHGQG